MRRRINKANRVSRRCQWEQNFTDFDGSYATMGQCGAPAEYRGWVNTRYYYFDPSGRERFQCCAYHYAQWTPEVDMKSIYRFRRL